jgi:alkanesulfonate monooxygenase SsuD/methylene tetrahydromethanopterin reductase-like flavin-dependent oxidoreductase (luciferase family)
MRFGLFGGARTKRSVGLGDSHGYKDFIDYVQEAERLGFAHMFMVEHHFTGQGQVSASMTLLSYLAAKTERIRLGSAWARAIALRNSAAFASRPKKRPNASMKRWK